MQRSIRITLMCFSFLLIQPLSSYGQTLIVQDTDTSVLISLDQARHINAAYSDLDGCNELKTSLEATLDTCHDITITEDSYIELQKLQLFHQKDQLSQLYQVINLKDDQLDNLKHQLSLSKAERSLSFGIIIVLGTLLILK